MAYTMKSTIVLYSILSLTTTGVGAASNFNNGDASRNAPYLYSEIQPVDIDVIYQDEDTSPSSDPTRDEKSQSHEQSSYEYRFPHYESQLSEIESDSFDEHGSSPSIVESAVLYDGDCYVSSEAMMCHGGGFDSMIDSFANFDAHYEVDDSEPTDEDDDDDDNDGHSSMLSTASLRRSQSTTRREQTRCHAGSRSTRSNKYPSTYTDKVVRLNNVLRLQSQLIQQQDRPQQQPKHRNHKYLHQQRTETVAFIRERA